MPNPYIELCINMRLGKYDLKSRKDGRVALRMHRKACIDVEFELLCSHWEEGCEHVSGSKKFSSYNFCRIKFTTYSTVLKI